MNPLSHQPRHVREILASSSDTLRNLAGLYSLEQLRDALNFALSNRDFARSGLWSKTKQVTLERVIRQREKARAKEREAERKWRMSMQA